MKKIKVGLTLAVLALAAFVVTPNDAIGAVITKLHTSAQLLINRPSATVAGLSAGNIASQTVSVVDLSGGDLDKCSYAVSIASAAGAGTLTFTMKISPDGGTNYIDKDIQTIAPNGTTSITSGYYNLTVQPGTKLKIVPTITTGCTFYGLKLWAMPGSN